MISVIDLNFCSEPINLHCPCCGQIIFSLGVLQTCCEHVIFYADSVSNCWSWRQKYSAEPFEQALKQKFVKACTNGFYGSQIDYYNVIKADTVATLAGGAYTSKSAIMFTVATSDKGCGGMHNGTIHAIFDFIPHPKLCLSSPS